MARILSFLCLAMSLVSMSPAVKIYRDCQEIFEKRPSSLFSGVYLVQPENSAEAFEVYCENDTSGEVWTWIQHREDGSVDFAHNWLGYKSGFGDVAGEFWLGNEKIYLLTNQAEYQIKFEMTHITLGYADASYRHFRIEDESDKYRLRLGDFTGGSAGNSMDTEVLNNQDHNNQQFTTIDQDNDDYGEGNCAINLNRLGGWWYDKCDSGNFNNIYYASGSTGGSNNGIEWRTLTGSDDDSMIKATMKIQRKSHFLF